MGIGSLSGAASARGAAAGVTTLRMASVAVLKGALPSSLVEPPSTVVSSDVAPATVRPSKVRPLLAELSLSPETTAEEGAGVSRLMACPACRRLPPVWRRRSKREEEVGLISLFYTVRHPVDRRAGLGVALAEVARGLGEAERVQAGASERLGGGGAVAEMIGADRPWH